MISAPPTPFYQSKHTPLPNQVMQHLDQAGKPIVPNSGSPQKTVPKHHTTFSFVPYTIAIQQLKKGSSSLYTCIEGRVVRHL